jgi:hypothetical protein
MGEQFFNEVSEQIYNEMLAQDTFEEGQLRESIRQSIEPLPSQQQEGQPSAGDNQMDF